MNIVYRNGKYAWICPKCATNLQTIDMDAVDLVNYIIDHYRSEHA